MAKLRPRADRPGARRRRSLAEALEPRILLSADLPGISHETALPSHDDTTEGRHELVLADESVGSTLEQHSRRHELVFVDSSVEGYEQLIDDLREGRNDDVVFDIHVLDAGRDGVEQIGAALADRAGDVDAVHILSHGTTGGVQLGDTWLTSESLSDRAASVAGWSDAFSEGADLLLYGCDLAGSAEGQQLVDAIATLTGADVAASSDLTGAKLLGGDWDLEYTSGTVETAVAFGSTTPTHFTGVLHGTAIWSEIGSPVPETRDFDHLGFGSESPTANVGGTWRVMTGAESPSRDEMIVMGVDTTGQLSGQMWNGTSWIALPFNGALPQVARPDRQSFDVAYEDQSGDAILVYNNGRDDFSSISYQVWNGTTWSGPTDIALPAPGEPEQLHLAAKPGSDEMILVAGNDADETYALVWNGSSWGNAASLYDGLAAAGNTDISVGYEQQSGQAMVVYAKAGDDAYYRMWSGSSWGAEGSINAPAGATDQPRWTNLASDPTSDRIALSVISDQREVWLSVWSGTAWQTSQLASTDSPHFDHLNAAVAFESQSGQAIATYATTDTRVTYRTWSSAGGWSAELHGPDLGNHSHAMTLDADPYSNQVMLSVQEQGDSVDFVAWSGSSWGAPNMLEADTGTGRGQPFLFLWDAAPVPGRPTADASQGAPYVINEGDSLTLDGSTSFDPEAQTLTYKWDLDGDGDFDEIGEPTGVNPTLSWATLESFGIKDEGAYQVGLRVTDTDSLLDTTTTTLTVVNAAPSISVTGPGSVREGDVYTLDFSATDPGDDAIIGWTINWGDGTIDTVGDVTSATHVYTQAGFTQNITVSVEDEDGIWTNSDLLVGSWRPTEDALHRFDGSTGDFDSTASSGGQLARPYAAIVGPDGSYYVSGYNSNNIGRFDAAGNYLGELIAPGTAGLSRPDGLAFGADGNLYVANFGGNNILRFDAAGNFIDVFGLGGGGMNGPSGIAFGPDGDLYVSSWTNGRLMKYDGETGGAAISVIGSGLASPEQIVFDQDGNLYVADEANNAVKKWDGSSLTTYFSHPQLDTPTGLAFGPDGALYVSSYNNDQILRYDGSTTTIFADSAGNSLDQPAYLLFTPDVRVHVTGVSAPPVVTGSSTLEDTQSTTGLVIDRNASDGIEVTHFKITAISNGTLYHADGTTPINEGDFITWAEGNAGLKFTPSPDYAGPASFDVQASSTGDDTELSAATTATITVSPVNDAPAGSDGSITTVEDVAYTLTAADFGFSDAVEGDGFAGVLITTAPTGGTLRDGTTVLGDGDSVSAAAIAAGDLVFTPAPDESGIPYAILTFQVRDDGGTANAGVDLDPTPNTLTIDVTPMNDTPLAAPDAAVVAEGASVNIDLAGNDSDMDDGLDLASIQIVSGPSNGSLAVRSDGTVDYTHDGSETPADSFSYQIRDAAGQLSNIAMVSLTVTPTNDAPTAAPDAALGAEGGTITIDLAGNDTDPDDGLDLASIQIVSGPSNGSVVVNVDGTVSYSHDGSESLFDSFTYTIRDMAGATSNTETVLVGLWPTNDAPIASGDSAVASEGGSTNIDLAANDTDIDSALDLASIQIVSGPGAGSLVVNADGSVDYSHDGSETTSDSFTYTILDDSGAVSNTATVTLSITPVNDAPTAADDIASVIEGGNVTIDLAANDTDIDSTLNLASIQIVSAPSNGSVLINADGSVEYRHDGSETTTDSFTYTILDDAGGVSNTATVSLSITPVNDAPTALDDSASVAEGGTVAIDLAANDTDVDSALNLASIQILTGPANGSLVVNADGSVDYSHDGSETSTDSFTYTIRDDAGAVSNTATVSLTVTPVNDAPRANDDASSVAEGGNVIIDLAANDTDVDSALNLASIQIVSGPSNGSLLVNADGSVEYRHDGSETTADSFTYRILDASGAVSNTATVSLTITPTNDAPVGADKTVTTLEDTPYTFSTSDFGFSDPAEANGFLGVYITSAPGAGTLRAGGSILIGGETVSAASIAAGDLVFTPGADGSGTAYTSFDFQVRDDGGTASGGVDLDPAPDTITIDVTGQNDAPLLLRTNPTLGSITEDELANSGQTVASILGSAVTDVDASASEGIAITRLASGNGSWEFSTDDGATWSRVGPVGGASALLLRDIDKVRFVPDGENADSASFRFRAWDQTGGVFATKADARSSGGSSAFSTRRDTASIVVSPVNDAPSLADSTLAPVVSGASDPPGAAIGGLFAGRFSDVDSGASFSGIAVVGNPAGTATEGDWQYSSDGGASWFAIGNVGDDSSALALSAGAQLRFVPAAGYDGAAPALQMRGLDDSYAGGFSSTLGGIETRANFDTAPNGGTSPISGTIASVSTQVLPFEGLILPEPETPPTPPDDGTDVPEDAGGETNETPDPGGEEVPYGPAPEATEVERSSRPLGSSTEPFTPTHIATAPSGLDYEQITARDLLLHDSRADKAEMRASVESRGEGLSLVHGASDLGRELDRLRKEVTLDSVVEQRVFGSSVALTAGLSIGYIVWLTRGGLLIASLVSSMPVWKLIDPVPILAALGASEDEEPEDGESLSSILGGDGQGRRPGGEPSTAENDDSDRRHETEGREGV